MENQNVQQPVSQAPVQPQEPVVPSVNQTPVEVHEEQVNNEVVTHIQTDPAFNCPDCAGEGLKDEYTVCPRCSGTGKV